MSVPYAFQASVGLAATPRQVTAAEASAVGATAARPHVPPAFQAGGGLRASTRQVSPRLSARANFIRPSAATTRVLSNRTSVRKTARGVITTGAGARATETRPLVVGGRGAVLARTHAGVVRPLAPLVASPASVVLARPPAIFKTTPAT